MKKITVFICSLILVLSLVGAANALVFTDEKDFGFCPIVGEIVSGEGSITWSHATPKYFAVPPDTVNSAKLEIWTNFANNNNDTVWVETTLVGTLGNDGFWDWAADETEFNITGLFSTWALGNKLDVTLKYKDCFMTIYKSVFTLDYNPAGGNTAPVPEPATLLLLGTGLLGLVGAKRKRLIKRA